MKTPLFILLQATGGIRNEVNTFICLSVSIRIVIQKWPITMARRIGEVAKLYRRYKSGAI